MNEGPIFNRAAFAALLLAGLAFVGGFLGGCVARAVWR